MDPVNEFLVTYLDSIDERLPEYLDEDEVPSVDTGMRGAALHELIAYSVNTGLASERSRPGDHRGGFVRSEPARRRARIGRPESPSPRPCRHPLCVHGQHRDRHRRRPTTGPGSPRRSHGRCRTWLRVDGFRSVHSEGRIDWRGSRFGLFWAFRADRTRWPHGLGTRGEHRVIVEYGEAIAGHLALRSRAGDPTGGMHQDDPVTGEIPGLHT
jgi:hypothetical protein